jgi:hypothetical protein
MPKFCMKCGRENTDQSAFCEACGAPFPEVQPPPAPPQSVKSFVVVKVAGEHQHVVSDYAFDGPDGRRTMTARKTSMIHETYDIVDAGGYAVAKLNHKTHLTSTEMEIYDSAQNLVYVVHFKGRQQGTGFARFPNTWVTDASGNTVASVTFSRPIDFQVSRADGSPIMTAVAALEGGVLNEMVELSFSRCEVKVLDTSFPDWKAAGLFVAADVGRRTSQAKGHGATL